MGMRLFRLSVVFRVDGQKVSAIEKWRWIAESPPTVKPIVGMNADRKMEMGGKSSAHPVGAADGLPAFDDLACFHQDLADLCVQRLAPTVLDFDRATEPASFTADLDDAP